MKAAALPTSAPEQKSPGEAPDAALPDAADRDVATLTEENAGLSEELLRCYEQLNLVFRITEKATALRDGTTVVVEMLLDLGDMLQTREVWFEPAVDDMRRVYLARNSENELRRCDHAPRPPSAVGSFPSRGDGTGEADAEAHLRTVVCAVSPHLLVGTLVAADEVLGTVALQRPDDTPEFESSELLLGESVLGYAGHVLENLRLCASVKRMSVEVVRALVNAIDKKDHYTSNHSDRVGYLAHMIGRGLRLRPRELEELEWAALLHDIGKIGVSRDILTKPAKLTDSEFAAIKEHPRMSYEVLKPIECFRSVLRGVLFHHENYDGSGYPYGLAGDDIPLFGRIIHVVDVFDALTSDRSYRSAFTWEKGLEIVESEAGTKLDPEIATCFVTAIGNLDPETRATLEEMSHDEA